MKECLLNRNDIPFWAQLYTSDLHIALVKAHESHMCLDLREFLIYMITLIYVLTSFERLFTF